jgi:alpha-2-macroglobulin
VAAQPRTVGAVLLLCLVSCTSPGSVDAGSDQLQSLAPVAVEPAPPPAPVEPLRPAQLTFTAPDCERPDCVITLAFSHPVVDDDQLSSAPAPDVTFRPKLRGTFRWTSSTELSFTPSAPLTAGTGLIITVKGTRATDGTVLPLEEQSVAIGVSELMIAGKVVEWPVLTGFPRLVTPLTDGAAFGSSGLMLVFDQSVEPSALKKKIEIVDESDGSKLAFTVDRPDTTAPMYDAKIDLSLVARIHVQKLTDGQTIRVTMPSWEPGGKRPVATTDTRSFTARTKFDLTHAPSPIDLQRLPLVARLDFTATTPIDLESLRRAVTLEPTPRDFSVSGWSATATLSMTLDPGVNYRLLVDGARDLYGNRSKRISMRLRAQDLKPLILAPAVGVMVERSAPRFPVRVVNSGPLTATIYRADLTHFLSPVDQTACTGEPLTTRRVPVTFAVNETGVVDVPLAGLKGFLCVEVSGEGRGSEKMARSASAHVQSSDVSATVKLLEGGVLVWATHLSDAKPIAKAKVELLSRDGRSLKKATTDDDGLVRLSFTGVNINDGEKLMVVVSEKSDVAVIALSEQTLSHAWQFGLPEQTGAAKLDAVLFTERGVYRPGETVHVKAILPSAGVAQLRITDARGQAVLDKKLQLDTLGSGDLDLKLNEKAAVGGYNVRLTRDGRSTTRNFQVQEYRVPTFEVKLSSAERWSHGPTGVLVDAKYFHGTAMAGRDLKWTLYGEPETFAPAAFPGYVFTPSAPERTAELAQGESKLDGSGQAKLEFNTNASTGPVRHVLEASVTDVDRQVWTGRLARVVHPTELYVGIRPPTRGVLSAKEILEVPVVVVTTEQAPRAGVEVDVVLEQIEYASSTRLLAGRGSGWVSSERDNVRSAKEVDRCRIVSTLQAQTCKVTLPAPGSYRVMATARTGARSPQTSFTVSAAGDGVVAWPRFDRERIDVVADQKRYAVGDIARLVVQTPFVSAQGLLTVEAGGVLTQKRFEISKDTPALEVPITEAMVPNAFVSVVLLRGRVHDEKDAAGYETGAPAFRLGYARLEVDPGAQRLLVKVGSSEMVAKPGTVVQLEVKVADAKGVPTQGAVALAVVDEAVLGLTAHQTPDPLRELYAARSLGVRTADGRLDLVHSRRSRQEALFPGGDGDDSETFRRIVTGDLRDLFKSTAYWNPNVAVGADGIARVAVTLPDNLTTFRVMAIAFDGHGRVGGGDLKITVRKALMVQPVLPRFLYPGDTLSVEALAFNGTSKPGALRLSAMALEGLEALPGAKLVQTNTVQGGSSVKVGIPVRVTGRGTVTVRWAATLGNETDQVQVTIPILDAGAKRVVVASKQLSSNSGEVLVPLPLGRLPGSTEVEVMVSSSSLSELKDSVQYLMNYPNGCIEQTTSTAYPLVVLKDLLPEIGVTVNETDLKKFSEAGVKRLLSFQTTSGGLAYWPGSDRPHIFGTTFGLTALIEAKKRGFAVPDEAMNRAAKYLEASLKQGQITEEMPHAGMPDGDTRALVVLTLNRLGKPQPSSVSTLWTERAKLSSFGIAMLAVTVSEGGGDRSLLEPMLAHVQAESKKDEAQAWFEGARKGGYSMDSPLRTHAASLLAFSSGGAKGEMPGKLLTGLLKRKDGYGGWGNTQENVYGIMGIAKLAGGSGPAPQGELSIGGSQVAMEKLEAVGKSNRRYSVPGEGAGVKDSEGGTIRVGLDKRSGPPTFLTVRARYEVPLTGENRAAFAHGFEVKRTYETLEGSSLEGKPIPLGAVVRVRVSLSSKEKRNYVAVDDKLPAGLEPLNASLATTQRLELGDATPTTAKGLEVLSFQETRDSRVAFFADELPAGEYQWVYLARATTAGKFIRPPASAEAMYEPQVSGATSIEDVTVAPQ